MATSFHQWESDPLFAAAEVVQDSVDRLVFFHIRLFAEKAEEKLNERNKMKILSLFIVLVSNI